MKGYLKCMLPIVLKTQIFLNAKIQKSSTTLTTANGSRKNHGIRGHFFLIVVGSFVVAAMQNVLMAGLVLKNRLVSVRKITVKMIIQDLVPLVLRVKRSGAVRRYI